MRTVQNVIAFWGYDVMFKVVKERGNYDPRLIFGERLK